MGIECLRRTDERHYVYAMLCQDGDGPGYVKFGRSKHIGQRLSALRVACPIPAKYFAIIEVGSYDKSAEVEGALLGRFAERKKSGEWFGFDFTSKADKCDFNDGCREVFAMHLCGGPQTWWTKLNIPLLDREAKERQRRAIASGYADKIRRQDMFRREQKRAWKELDGFRSSII